MGKPMKKTLISKYLFAALSLSTAAVSMSVLTSIIATDVQAQEQRASEKKTRRTPAMRSRVYDQLARAQAQADADNIPGAIDILDEVKDKSGSMNSYELAMMYNFYGFIYYNDEQYDKAMDSFALVVEQQPIPESFELSTLFSLAQLNLMQGRFAESIEYLNRWESLNTGKIPPKNWVIKAQAYYQNKQYAEAETFITQAIENQEAEGMLPDEGWLILQRAIFYELKQPRKVKDVLVKMIKLYDEPKYWIQLAGMYGELGEEKNQLAIMEAAYQQGFVEKGADVFNLAQLYYYHRVPYKGALLMEQAIDEGTLEKNLRNLKFLGQSWTLAKENDKAVPALMAAAELADDGELDAQVAQILLNMERWDDAIAAAQRAVEKGDLRNPGTVYLVMGMAHFNKKEYALALNQLAEAEKHSSSRGMAKQWLQFVNGEKQAAERIAADLSS